MSHKKPFKICLMTTAPQSLYFFHKGWAPFFQKHGYEIIGIAGKGKKFHNKIHEEFGFKTYVAPIMREISFFKDIGSLFWLWWHFLWHRYDIIHLGTPKASLLGAIAAKLSFHKNIVMTHHGRVYENATGKRRTLFCFLEKITAICVSHCIPVARELGNNLVTEGGYSPDKMHFIGHGTCNGFDTSIYQKTPDLIDAGKMFRKKVGIPGSAYLVLFVGRLRQDKGVEELVNAFNAIAKKDEYLLLIGNSETDVCPISSEVRNIMENHPRIHSLDFMDNIQVAYSAADVFVLPSHREGFPLVPMEAAAMKLPVIASDISGCREAVVNGVTGLLFPKEDTSALAEALEKLRDNPQKRQQMGELGCERVRQDFQPQKIWEGILAIYDELLK